MKPLPEEGAGTRLGMVRKAIDARLAAAGIKESAQEARRLLLAVGGESAALPWLDPDAHLSADQTTWLEAACRRREGREPLPHILGEWGFWSLDLKVSKDVLTPRPQSEHLVQCALDALPGGASRVLDLGTGSGAIVLALLSEWPQAEAVAVDISAKALNIARSNARSLDLDNRVRFVEGGWDAALDLAPFDLVVSNPPYIARDEIATLAPEVRDFEPALALDGGKDGLDAYCAIVPLLPRYLSPKGDFALEIGAAQGEAVTALADAHKALSATGLVRDYGGRDRVVTGRHC